MNSGVSIISVAADVKKRVCTAQNPDLNLLEHLCDELEWRLQFCFSHPTMNTLLNLMEDVCRIVKVSIWWVHQRIGPCRLRIGRHQSSCTCKSRQTITSGNMVYLDVAL
ncbi:hypothetical protein GOODEAATRI_025664 [Goodea atripinnis]|uniref:Uncharacterized protein n=1 Tax=Goodea atripinnis TaxID=208336 RepID=A0ABV0P7T5_9TELE